MMTVGAAYSYICLMPVAFLNWMYLIEIRIGNQKQDLCNEFSEVVELFLLPSKNRVPGPVALLKKTPTHNSFAGFLSDRPFSELFYAVSYDFALYMSFVQFLQAEEKLHKDMHQKMTLPRRLLIYP